MAFEIEVARLQLLALADRLCELAPEALTSTSTLLAHRADLALQAIRHFRMGEERVRELELLARLERLNAERGAGAYLAEGAAFIRSVHRQVERARAQLSPPPDVEALTREVLDGLGVQAVPAVPMLCQSIEAHLRWRP